MTVPLTGNRVSLFILTDLQSIFSYTIGLCIDSLGHVCMICVGSTSKPICRNLRCMVDNVQETPWKDFTAGLVHFLTLRKEMYVFTRSNLYST